MTLDRLHKTLPSIAVLLALLSCGRTAPASFECSHVEYADSTGNVFLTINLELPTASAGPVKTVRDFLLSEFVGRLERFGCEEDGSYPLPVWEPSLSEDGVVFVYQQYEIAPYAYGMPSFTIPYDKVIDFLTPEARALSGRHPGS